MLNAIDVLGWICSVLVASAWTWVFYPPMFKLPTPEGCGISG